MEPSLDIGINVERGMETTVTSGKNTGDFRKEV